MRASLLFVPQVFPRWWRLEAPLASTFGVYVLIAASLATGVASLLLAKRLKSKVQEEESSTADYYLNALISYLEGRSRTLPSRELLLLLREARDAEVVSRTKYVLSRVALLAARASAFSRSASRSLLKLAIKLASSGV